MTQGHFFKLLGPKREKSFINCEYILISRREIGVSSLQVSNPITSGLQNSQVFFRFSDNCHLVIKRTKEEYD